MSDGCFDTFNCPIRKGKITAIGMNNEKVRIIMSFANADIRFAADQMNMQRSLIMHGFLDGWFHLTFSLLH